MARYEQDGVTIDLPDYKGQPYLWVQKKKPGGKAPDFTGTNPKKMRQAFKEDRCGACGLPMTGSWFFISDERSIAGRVPPFDAPGPLDPKAWKGNNRPIHLTEPPLHRFCARLAGRLCPVLRAHRGGVPPVIIEVPRGAVVVYGESVWVAKAGHYPTRVLSVEPIPKRGD